MKTEDMLLILLNHGFTIKQTKDFYIIQAEKNKEKFLMGYKSEIRYIHQVDSFSKRERMKVFTETEFIFHIKA